MHAFAAQADPLLLVDDDPTFTEVLGCSLRRRGIDVMCAHDAAAAEACLQSAPCRQAIVDLNLGGESGLNLIPRLLAIHASMRIVVLTGYASIATTVEAMRRGAYNYLPKPADVDTILAAFRDGASSDESAAAQENLRPMSVRRLEWEHLQRVLAEHDGNISAAARALGLHRCSLQRKLRKHAPGDA